MLRSGFAILAGFFVIVVGVLMSAPVVARVLHHETAPVPTPAYLALNLVVGFACALVGGCVAAWLSPRGPVVHADVLGGLVLVLGLWTAARGGAARAGQPQWYAWLLPFVGAAGAMLGGLLVAGLST
jgi:hypothetical protein